MTLFELQDYLRAYSPVTVPATAAKFGVAAGTVEAMLDYLERRGRVRTAEGGCSLGGLCRTCGLCSRSKLRFYEWVRPARWAPATRSGAGGVRESRVGNTPGP